MTERSDQVDKLLKAMARHSDLVADAFEGPIYRGDRASDAGIEQLFALGILKPYDEDTYRLNPRVRDLLSDHLSSYNAFAALRQISGTRQQAKAQLDEMRRLRNTGAIRELARLATAFDDSLVEIAYSIEQNLSMLHTLVSTQYGNVESLASKLRQNIYYDKQVRQFSADVRAIGQFCEMAIEQATLNGLPDVKKLVTQHLMSRLLDWSARIKDAQAVISRRLFEAKQLEGRLNRLARFSLWMVRHRTAGGWDLPVDETAPIALVRPKRIPVRMQPDIADTDEHVRTGLAAALARLPEKNPISSSQPVVHPPQIYIEEEEEAQEPEDPVTIAILDLADHLESTQGTVSLLGWKLTRPDLEGISDESWLTYAHMQMKSLGLQVVFKEELQTESFAINETFYDVEVSSARVRMSR